MSNGSSQPKTAERSEPPPRIDMNVERVREKLLQRSQRGIQKYGTTTERTDLKLLDWLRHAQEEMLDSAVYLERIIGDLTGPGVPTREQFYEFEQKRARTMRQIEEIERGGDQG